VNQFSVVENKHSRRPDVVLFVNGLPLAVLELKNAAAENATIWSAFQQLQTYQAEVPTLFAPNALLAVSDGVEARVGTLGAGREWFKPWRTIAGETLAELAHARVAGGDRGPVRTAALSRPAARLHRVRGRRRPHRQEDGRLPPVPRGAGGGERDAARGRLRAGMGPGALRNGPKPGGKPGDRASAWCGTRRARARA
jgi:type I restriction enzyme R subunit